MSLPRDGPRPENDNAHGEVGTVGDTKQLRHSDTTLPLAIRQGLTAVQVAGIVDHRRSKPNEPLPPAFQRELGHAWRQFAQGAR